MNSERKAHCNKVKHKTIVSAQIALKRTIAKCRKGDPIITGLSAYKCSYCDGYHVGRSTLKGIDWKEFDRAEKALAERRAASSIDRSNYRNEPNEKEGERG